MVNYLESRELRRVSAITFKIRPEIGFSISVPKKYDEKIGNNSFLVHYARNSKTDVSKLCLDFIFEELKVKTYNDLNKIDGMPEVLEQFRKVLYKALKKDRRGFSKWLSNKLINKIYKLKEEQQNEI